MLNNNCHVTSIGEEFYRNTGAVWWTVRCTVVPDGVGQIRVGDAIWPVADLVVAILVSVGTMGLGLTGSMLAVARVVAGTVSAGTMELMKSGE